MAATSDDPVVSASFLRVLNLIDEPKALFAPALMPRVLRAKRSRNRVVTDFTITGRGRVARAAQTKERGRL